MRALDEGRSKVEASTCRTWDCHTTMKASDGLTMQVLYLSASYLSAI